MTLFQSLAFAAGFDPIKGPGSSCSSDGSSGQCVLPWAGGTKSVSSIVLIANGVSFAVSICTWFALKITRVNDLKVMTIIFTTIGSAADYGTFGRWLLLSLTVLCWASQYAEISLTSMDVLNTSLNRFVKL